MELGNLEGRMPGRAPQSLFLRGRQLWISGYFAAFSTGEGAVEILTMKIATGARFHKLTQTKNISFCSSVEKSST
jgi:hypothetical protein